MAASRGRMTAERIARLQNGGYGDKSDDLPPALHQFSTTAVLISKGNTTTSITLLGYRSLSELQSATNELARQRLVVRSASKQATQLEAARIASAPFLERIEQAQTAVDEFEATNPGVRSQVARIRRNRGFFK